MSRRKKIKNHYYEMKAHASKIFPTYYHDEFQKWCQKIFFISISFCMYEKSRNLWRELEALWWLLLMTFLLIISIVHQHFFRHQHFQITNFSWSATFFASATFVKTERVLPFQYVLSTPTKSSSHKCKT